jgi:hypothetical protein
MEEKPDFDPLRTTLTHIKEERRLRSVDEDIGDPCGQEMGTMQGRIKRAS